MKKRIFDTMIGNPAENRQMRRCGVRIFDLRMFDEPSDDDDGGEGNDGDDDGGEGDDDDEGQGGTFTQADIDKAVSAALKRERAKAEKKAKEAAEAERLRNMSNAERNAEKLKALEAEVRELKGEKARGEMASTVRGMLSGAGVAEFNDDIVNALVVADDAEKTKGRVDNFVKAYKAAVAAGVKKAMGGSTPPDGNTRKRGKTLTKDEIMAVKDQTERQRLIRENINLFR